MDDGDDPRKAPRPAAFLGVDVALLTTHGDGLSVVLGQRQKDPEEGSWALPGVFMRPGVDPDIVDTARRALAEKLGHRFDGVDLRQLGAWHNPGRDPRGWVVSVVYFGFLASSAVRETLSAVPRARLFRLTRSDGSSRDAEPMDEDGHHPALAFDHERILAHLVRSIHRSNDVLDFAFDLLGPEFTFRELQAAYESLIGRRLNKDSFRRTIQARGKVVALSRWQESVDHRPAMLFARQSE